MHSGGGTAILAIVLTASVLISIGLNVHRARALRAAGRPIPVSLRVAFGAVAVAGLGAVVVLVADVFGL